MGRYCILKILVILIITLPLAPVFAARWDFNAPTAWNERPSEWDDASQPGDGSVPNAESGYQVQRIDGVGFLRIRTGAGTLDRPKLETQDYLGFGVYQWRVFVPWGEEDSSTVIGAFVINNYSGAEIDFEIGWGSPSERQALPILCGDGRNADIRGTNKLICFMTFHENQRQHHYKVHNKIGIEPNMWYILTLYMSLDINNRYSIIWQIHTDSSNCCYFWNPTIDTVYVREVDRPFKAMCSVENLTGWFGHTPQEPHHAKFDYVDYVNNSETNDGPRVSSYEARANGCVAITFNRNMGPHYSWGCWPVVDDADGRNCWGRRGNSSSTWENSRTIELCSWPYCPGILYKFWLNHYPEYRDGWFRDTEGNLLPQDTEVWILRR